MAEESIARDLFRRIAALITFRIIIVSILLGSFYVFKIGYDKLSHPEYFSYFIASLYFITIIYGLLLKYLREPGHLRVFAYIQIILDIVAETVLLYITGGIESMFSFLYPLSIISAAVVIDKRACYVSAAISSILYGLLLDFQYYKVIPIKTSLYFMDRDYFYNIFAHITAFFLIAFLSGYLSEKLHRVSKSLQERDNILSDLKAFNKYIVESMPSGVLTTDLEMRIMSFNSSAESITGLRRDQVIGMKLDDIFPFLQSHPSEIERIEGEIDRDGKRIAIGMRVSDLMDGSGKKIGYIGVFQDLTKLKEMEAEVKRKEKWAIIGELSASIAHELRNPLASLKGSIEMLKNGYISKGQADRLMEIAISEMNRLNSIITDFLQYARPRGPKKRLFDVSAILKEVIALVQSSLNGKDVKLLADLKEGEIISADPDLLRQVFWNLCKNAVEAIEDKGVVEIKAEKRDGTFEVIFKDNGQGLSKDEIEKIFLPFYTTKETGTGLGLAIAEKIIEEHGGKILVWSDGKGKGATFKVVIPIREEKV